MSKKTLVILIIILGSLFFFVRKTKADWQRMVKVGEYIYKPNKFWSGYEIDILYDESADRDCYVAKWSRGLSIDCEDN